MKAVQKVLPLDTHRSSSVITMQRRRQQQSRQGRLFPPPHAIATRYTTTYLVRTMESVRALSIQCAVGSGSRSITAPPLMAAKNDHSGYDSILTSSSSAAAAAVKEDSGTAAFASVIVTPPSASPIFGEAARTQTGRLRSYVLRAHGAGYLLGRHVDRRFRCKCMTRRP